MNILGLNYLSHDAAAALVVDGKLVSAAEEERFNRKKHTKNFPINALNFCLEQNNLNINNIDYIALFIKPSLQYRIILPTMFSDFPKSLGFIPHAISLIKKRNNMEKMLVDMTRISPEKIIYVPHHLAHAASSFYMSPFDEAAILTVDGRGEYESIALFNGQKNSIKKIYSVKYPNSVGYLYSMITKFLGFETQNDEYKVMGLSAYGTPRLVPELEKLVKHNHDGKFELDLDFFDHHYSSKENRKLFTQKFIDKFGLPRDKDSPVTSKHADIAYAVQKITENILLSQSIEAKKRTGHTNLCLAGGVALNCLANQKIIESGIFERVFVQPAANDAGTAIGSALYAASILDSHKLEMSSEKVYLGPQFSNEEIYAYLKNNVNDDISYSIINNPSVVAANLINQNKVIGWFQGKMEFGPRALGNRSILASPTNAEMKDIVNTKIKFRESFRPFAPAVLSEFAAEYFDLQKSGEYVYPFMLATTNAKAKGISTIPAVIHADQTSRIQVVSRETNNLFWDLINEYYKLSGIPVVLNTSFNINKEAIVCTPKDAIYNFQESGLDYLIMGNYLINKNKYI